MPTTPRKIRCAFPAVISRRAIYLTAILLATTESFGQGFNHAKTKTTRNKSTIQSKVEASPPTSPPKPHPDYDIIIAGGGIAGLALAVGLYSRNVTSVLILEKSPQLRTEGAILGYFKNGATALKAIDANVAQRVMDGCIPWIGSHAKNMKGEIIHETLRDNNDGADNNTANGYFLLRYFLQEELVRALPEGMMAFGTTFDSYEIMNVDDNDDDKILRVNVTTRTENGILETKAHTCRVLVGADGIKSKVRTELFGYKAPLYFYNRVLFRGLVNLNDIDEQYCPPSGYAVTYRCGAPGKGIAIRETYKGILTYTASVVTSSPDIASGSHTEIKERLRKLFSSYPSQVSQIIERSPSDTSYAHAIYDVDVADCWSGPKGEPIILIGDAAHAMTPSWGQGANIALEDACELAEALGDVLVQTQSMERQRNRDRNIDAKSTEVSSTTTKSSEIAKTLEEFWKGRIDRVREVHCMSRERARAGNEQRNIVDYRSKYSDFSEQLFCWRPSFFDLRESRHD